jgi:aminoglycoside phosphotransferase (APT) family kinase protein
VKRYFLIFLCCVTQFYIAAQCNEGWENHPVIRSGFEQFLGDIHSYTFRTLVGGLISDAPCVCTVNDHTYVTRIFRGSPQARQTQIDMNCFVANCGIAPQIYHHGHHDDFSFIIMDFVDMPTLSFEQGVQRVVMDSVAYTLRSIAHIDTALETNNKENYFEEGMRHYHNIKQRNFTNFDPVLEEIKDKMEVVVQKLNSYNRPLVMSHNDFQPRNMFFNHGSMVVIDWDFMGLNYECADLAAYSVYFCLHEEDDLYLLTRYLQHAPSTDDVSYFKTVKMMTRLLYIVSFFELIHVVSEVESIADFKHYARLFAQDATHDSSEFFYALGMSQLQELRLEYEMLKKL